MVCRSIALCIKRITIPRLSPTHTKAKVTQFLVKRGDAVEPYDTVFVMDCSPDFITEGFRDSPDQEVTMIIENQEDGTITEMDESLLGKWLDVDTPIGLIDDGDDANGDWTWQAYKHDNEK